MRTAITSQPRSLLSMVEESKIALWDRYIGGDGVVLVQKAGSIADGNAGILTRVGEKEYARLSRSVAAL